MLVDLNLLRGGGGGCVCFDQGEEFQFFFHCLFLFVRFCLIFPSSSHLHVIGRFGFLLFSQLCVHFVADIILILVTKSGLVSRNTEDFYFWKAKTILTIGNIIIGGK